MKIERRKALALLVYLAVAGEPHRRDTLATLFWPDYGQSRARAALRRTLSVLIKVLGRDALEVDREVIGLPRTERSRGLWFDVDRFHELVAACRAHGHAEVEVCPECLSPLTEAVALYRGDFLYGFTLRDSADFDDWQTLQAEALRRELAGALERLARGYSARHEFEAAIHYARRWLMLDPLHEPAHCYLMSLYAWAGQRQAAQRQYAECVRLLERELGAAPQATTTQLYEAIKQNAQPPPVGLHSATVWSREALYARPSSLDDRQPRPETSPQSSSLLDRIVHGQLVGREREAAQISALWARVAAGHGSVLLVSGEAGIGKTRMAREAAVIAAESGARVLIGRCDAESAAPNSPIAQMIRGVLDSVQGTDPQIPDFVLADLLTLAPQLRPRYRGIEHNSPLGPELERQRVFDSFVSWCEILAGQDALLLWVEDVHWADSGTLSLLRHLAQRMHDMRILLVLTYRDADGELAEARTLKETLLDLNRHRLAEHLNLARFNREQTRDLLGGLLATGGEITPEFLDSVYRETDGNPFYIEEVCKALIEEGKLYFAGGYWRRADIETVVIPQSIREAILLRIERLPTSIQDMLRLAAVLGREFDFAVLQAMGGWDEETLIGMLEHVRRTQLIAEASRLDPFRFAFVHALIPFTLRESMSGLRLQRLHHRAARAIEALLPHEYEALAHHFTAAAERGKAIDYSLRAAQRAESLFAYDTAIQHLHAAINMLEVGDSSAPRLMAQELLADVYRLRGERTKAMLVYQEALDQWRSQAGGDKWVAVRLCRKLHETFLLLGSSNDIQRFEALSRAGLECGLGLIEGEPPHPEAVLLLATMANDTRGTRPQQDWDTAERFARTAVTMAEQLDAPVELASALAALATVYGVRGLLRERVQLVVRCVAVSRDPRFGDRRDQCRHLCEAGNALLLVGEYAEALPYLLEAEHLADLIRDASQQVHALGLQAQCFYGLDRWDEMLQIEQKRQALEDHYGHDRVGIMCFYCGLSANVSALRGDYERANSCRKIAYNNMAAFFGGPPEGGMWSRGGHY
ncbi:MAG: AAA family ATPase [Caldilineaceae bacterium]|nr:AAA family ATPase [Caldilineaceae bacterium]